MNATTKTRFRQALVWLIWFLVLLVTARGLGLAAQSHDGFCSLVLPPSPVEPLAGIAACPPRPGPLFPWGPRFRWRKWALVRYQAWKRRLQQARWAYRKAAWAARLARLALTGALPLAAIVDWLTRSQLRRQLGALPILYALLEILQVRAIVNRHCPTRREVDNGAVVLVLILNRMLAPRGLYRIADWLAQTTLVTTLGLPAAKFNDDRLGRALEEIAPHLRAIWIDIVDQAIRRFDTDLRVIFYDLTAFIVHGEYAASQWADFGFAHNTPMNKRKVKVGLDTTADGHIPTDYAPWAGRTADRATVQANMERLVRLFARHGYTTQETLIVGDRANLNDELALAYDRRGLHYLAGLEAQKTAHRALLTAYPEEYFRRHPLGQAGYYGLPCAVPFAHQGQQVVHRGLVVLSGPMRRAFRCGRAKQLRALFQELAGVAARIGQRGYRSAAEVQRRAETKLRRSPVGPLVQVWTQEEDSQVRLRWQVDRAALQEAMRRDGRYLLVTNDPALTPTQMLALYRAKDGEEKRFTVCKKDQRLVPLYLHKDTRIEALLLVHMLALLAYSILERQARQHGLTLTTRRIIATLEDLAVIETHCWDGSVLVRLTPLSVDQAQLLVALAEVIAAVRWPRPQPALVAGPTPLSLPGQGQDLSPGGAPLLRRLLAA